MSIPEERRLRLNKIIDQIGFNANVNFRNFVLSSKEVSELIARRFPKIKGKSEEIARFCLTDVAKYYNKGVVIFIDGCRPGQVTLDGINHKEAFGNRLSYLLCAQIAYSQNISEESMPLIFNSVDFDYFADSVFNFDECGKVFDKLISTQVLLLSNVGIRAFDKLAMKTYQKCSDRFSGAVSDFVPEKAARISSAIDNLISSRIRLNRPTIISVFDDFEIVFNHRCIGNILKDISSRVVEPKDVNDFSDNILLRGCCRLCLVYTKDYERFGSGKNAEILLKERLEETNISINNFDSFSRKIKQECNDLNIRSDDVFYGLRNDIDSLHEVCGEDNKMIYDYFNSIFEITRIYCILKGVKNG